jgi:hypothetical protein
MVDKNVSNQDAGTEERQPMREYSHLEELINNVPYMAMIVLGIVILAMGVEAPMWKWIVAGLYLIYGAVGAFWIMVFICPYCRYWNTRSCPCGYGHIAAMLRDKKPQDCFNEKFKKHIPVIVPLWFIPVLVGAVFVVHLFSWLLLVLLVIFALNSFVVLPLVSTKHGCKKCPQRDTCPWMNSKTKPSNI